MTHLDLFTGIGGFHLAAGWAGFETIGFSEIDPYCCRLLAEKWPDIPNYGDIRRADFSGLRGGVTVLSAGVPCQPASLAGKRRGSKDDRWLWDAVLDVVESVQPTWCVFENPPGILTLDEFGGVLLRLESLGYALRLFSVPANALGARHRRVRVFIIGHAERTGSGAERTSGMSSRDDSAIVAHAERERWGSRRNGWTEEIGKRSCIESERPSVDSEALADAMRPGGRQDSGGASGDEGADERWTAQNGDESDGSGEALADADRAGLEEHEPRQPGQLKAIVGSSGESLIGLARTVFRLTEPPLCRRVDGIPNRSHRLRALGNAVVPQQAYPFFAAIAEVERVRT